MKQKCVFAFTAHSSVSFDCPWMRNYSGFMNDWRSYVSSADIIIRSLIEPRIYDYTVFE